MINATRKLFGSLYISDTLTSPSRWSGMSRVGESQTLSDLDDIPLSSPSARIGKTYLPSEGKFVKKEKLLKGWTQDDCEISEISDTAKFRVGFIRKECLPHMGDRMINHSSVALLNEENKKYILIGRQSTFFLKEKWRKKQGLDAAPQIVKVSDLLNPFKTYGYIKHAGEALDTTMDNEAKYEFFEGARLKLDTSSIVVTGEKIKGIIEETNVNTCRARFYNPLFTNCYTSSIFMLCRIIQDECTALLSKDHCSEDNLKKLTSLYKIILDADRDNFKIGVINNGDVLEEIKLVNEYLSSYKQRLSKKSLNESLDELGVKKVIPEIAITAPR